MKRLYDIRMHAQIISRWPWSIYNRHRPQIMTGVYEMMGLGCDSLACEAVTCEI